MRYLVTAVGPDRDRLRSKVYPILESEVATRGLKLEFTSVLLMLYVLLVETNCLGV